MKQYLKLFATVAAGMAVLASCNEGSKVDVPAANVYITTGTTPSDEVTYVRTYNALTGKDETVGNTTVNLKFCSTEAVAANVSGEIFTNSNLVKSGYQMLPENAYSIVSASSTIEAGKKEGTTAFQIELAPEALTEVGAYMLPVVIKVTDGNAEVNAKAECVYVKVTYNKINDDIVEPELKRISNDRLTLGEAAGYEGIEYEGLEIANAFDDDINTEWCCGCYDYDTQGYSSSYGASAMVTFDTPVSLAQITVAISPESADFKYRARRLTIFFKFEGESDFNWDSKPWNFDDNGDEGEYTVASNNEGVNISEIPGYQGSAADFLVDANDTCTIDLTEATGGRKVEAIVIIPATIYCYQGDWNDTDNDFNYLYYYDAIYGTNIGDFYLYEK
ncbi:MAG: DUF1735 domain-containing protein [Clostridium sp.]|nr:DUF1735 domain-containing protein [Bacteroides sp.]MCM1199428.1 DUF1735 domain-containing protein [Clostridium sp.]